MRGRTLINLMKELRVKRKSEGSPILYTNTNDQGIPITSYSHYLIRYNGTYGAHGFEKVLGPSQDTES